MTTATFRPLTTDERSILDRMLESDFPGRDAAREQLSHATARTIDTEGSLEIRTESDAVIRNERTVVAESWYLDDDGMVVNLLLHVSQGKIRELEIYKDDSSPVRKRPSADILDLTSRYDDAGRARA